MGVTETRLIPRGDGLGGLYWCGYVCVDKDHPWYGESWGSDVFVDVDVTGGITYGRAEPPPTTTGYKPQSMGGWWIGFDTARGTPKDGDRVVAVAELASLKEQAERAGQ